MFTTGFTFYNSKSILVKYFHLA